MIFALGTPVNARFRPWIYDWVVEPDALMISALDFLSSPKTFSLLQRKGIHDLMDWDGLIICDSGAFSALNRKTKVSLKLDRLISLYQELNNQDPSVLKITLDFPDDKIIENFEKLYSLGVEPVIPHNNIELIESLYKITGQIEWMFIGRLVPLMRKGGDHLARLSPVLDTFRKKLADFSLTKTKIWALGVGAPSILPRIRTRVDGCDSSRWRVTGSNMILLPEGGERGVGNRTKWRGTHHRIDPEREKILVINILKKIDELCGGLEQLDNSLASTRSPKQLKGTFEVGLPLIGELMVKLRENSDKITVYDLELILRTSGNLRLLFNYWSALSFIDSE